MRLAARSKLVALLALGAGCLSIGCSADPADSGTRCRITPSRSSQFLCRHFAVFRRAQEPEDRLPPWVRESPPAARHRFDFGSSRRLGGRPAYYAVTAADEVCLIRLAQRSSALTCAPPRAALAHGLVVTFVCAPKQPRRTWLVTGIFGDRTSELRVLLSDRSSRRPRLLEGRYEALIPRGSGRPRPVTLRWRRAGRRWRSGIDVSQSDATARCTAPPTR
jgi:hypothetical protein